MVPMAIGIAEIPQQKLRISCSLRLNLYIPFYLYSYDDL